MKSSVILTGMLAGLVLMAGMSAQAATPHKERSIDDTYSPGDTARAQVFLEAAMTTPMMDLLQKADVTNPQAMLEYGLALELGRPSVAQALPKDIRDKLKSDYRAMLDLYLNAGDKKDPLLADINFESDAMLDNQEFWVDLAKQIGRPKERQPIDQVVPGDAMDQGGGAVSFIPDPQDEGNGLNLSKDLVLKREVVNAAAGCAESATGFAKMKKAQTVDISATKLSPTEFASMKAEAVRVYRISYSTGSSACGSRDYFFKVSDFASQNLGVLGQMKDDPAASVASLDTGGASANN